MQRMPLGLVYYNGLVSIESLQLIVSRTQLIHLQAIFILKLPHET